MGKNLLETITKGDGTSFVTVTVAPDASKDERKKGNSVVAKLTNGMRQVLRESWPRFVIVPCVRRVLAVRSCGAEPVRSFRFPKRSIARTVAVCLSTRTTRRRARRIRN